jgi:hypothetical protein
MLRNNLITEIKGTPHAYAGLNQLPNLVELELYDNKIVKIDGLQGLLQLVVLDLSYNNIKKIENISHLKKLKKLFLLSNKIKKVALPLARLRTWTSLNWRCWSWGRTRSRRSSIWKESRIFVPCSWARTESVRSRIWSLW